MNLLHRLRRQPDSPKAVGDHHRWPGRKWSRWLADQSRHADVRAFDDCAGAPAVDIEPAHEPIFTP